jgi:hypothetical protein
MNSVTQEVEIFNHQGKTSPDILNQIDLIEYEVDFHWSRFEESVEAAQHHLECFDLATSERRKLAKLVSQALAQAEAVMA